MGLGSAVGRAWERVRGIEAGSAGMPHVGERKTAVLPAGLGYGVGSVLTPFRNGGGVANNLPKPTANNLRRLAETPAARRAINCIKDQIAAMDWRIEVRPGVGADSVGDRAERVATLTAALGMPNESDSFRTLMEPIIEDILVGGFGAAEVELGDPSFPIRMYAVDGATIQVNPEWSGDAETPRYAQVTGRIGAEGRTMLLDRELMYIRLNARTHTVFGLGKMEVAFEAINSFLSAHRYAGKLASNGTVQYALWLQDRTPEQHERLTRWWQEEVEGSGKTPILSSETAPEVIRLGAGTDAELRMQWQQFLLTMIANAFDLPPMLLGVTGDVNKATAGEMAEQAFQSAVIPLAKLLGEHLTRDVIAKRLGWNDLRFVWSDLESRDEATEVSIQMQLLNAGVLSVDEVRRMRGLPERAADAVQDPCCGAGDLLSCEL